MTTFALASDAVVGRVAVADGEIAYEERGSGPPIVFVHSAGGDRGMWRPVIELICGRYRCIAVDQRGFGDSSTPHAPFADHDDLLAACAALDVRKPIFVGNSLGGLTVLDAAIAEPGLPAGLVLLAAFAGGWTYTADVLGPMQTIAELATERGDDAALEADIDFWLLYGRDRDAVAPEARAYVRAARGRTNERRWAQSLRRPSQSLSLLDRVAVPAAIVVGEHDVRDFREIGRLLHDGIAGSTLQTLPTGHFVSLEDPRGVAGVIDALAERIAARA